MKFDKHKELNGLINNSLSMDFHEKKIWKDMMEHMDDSQLQRLYDIFETERAKLEELDRKYEAKVREIDEWHAEEVSKTKLSETWKTA